MATVESLWYTVHSHMTIPGGGATTSNSAWLLKIKTTKNFAYKSVMPLIWVKKHGAHTHV